MINYIDCPECGTNKIRSTVSRCSDCEISSRFEQRVDYLTDQVCYLKQKLLKINNLSKHAWEQVANNPEEAKNLFKMINSLASDKVVMQATCSCVGGKMITVSESGCGETLCKAVRLK